MSPLIFMLNVPVFSAYSSMLVLMLGSFVIIHIVFFFVVFFLFVFCFNDFFRNKLASEDIIKLKIKFIRTIFQ